MGDEQVERLRARIRKLEAEVQAKETLLRAVIDATPGGAVFVYDRDLRYRYVGGRGLKDVDLDWHAMEGRTVREALGPSEAARVEGPYREALAGHARLFEMDFKGRQYAVSVDRVPLDDQELGVVVTRDLSSSRAIEADRDRLALHKQLIVREFPGAVFLFDAEGRYVDVGGRALVDGGVDLPSLIGRTPHEVLPDPGASNVLEAVQRALDVGEAEFDHPWDGGRIFSTHYRRLDDVGAEPMVLVVSLDVTREREAEARQARSLAQKEALLREVHHRVKNNMQVVQSLLSVTARRLSSQPARDALADVIARVRAMATVHERLYAQDDLASIDIDVLVRELVDELVRSRPELEPGMVQVESCAVQGSTEFALELGLVLVELVTNAARHGIPGGASQVRVVLGGDEQQVELEVCDDGPGLPSDVDPDTTRSTGLWLVRTTVQRRGGALQHLQEEGTCWHVRLPLLAP